MANTSIKSAFERMWQHTTAAIDEAKSYTNVAVANTKNDLLNGAGEAYDTLKELGDLIDENVDAIQALEGIATGKQDKLSGVEGQIISFDAEGKAVAQSLDTTLTQSNIPADAKAVGDALADNKLYVDTAVSSMQPAITGTAGQFVVIGSDGNATTENPYTYSQTDLEAGVSALETGKLYFVYE